MTTGTGGLAEPYDGLGRRTGIGRHTAKVAAGMEELDDDLESEIPDLTQLGLDSLRDDVLGHAIRRFREEAASSDDAIAGFQSFI